MNRKKINWGLSVIFTIAFVSFLWTSWRKVKEDNFQYAKDFNNVRDSLGIPRIEDNWVLYGGNKWRRYWTHPERGVNSDKPTHLGKTSNFKGDTLISEEDDFHYEKTDSLAYRVVYVYRFDSAIWSSKIIEYKRQEYLETSSKCLTLIQADSILNEWKLRRSHDPQQGL